MGLSPECVHETTMDIDWKLYELDSRFYRGRPKDGSIRTADLPPFLADLLAWHLETNPRRKCTCRNTEEPWCPGGEYVFLGQRNAHHRRSNYATRIVRPAADGWYPQRNGRYGRPAAPVLADASAPWPGIPLSPWPPATPGEPYAPPTGRGIPRFAGKEGNGRCPACNRTIVLRQDGTLIRHKLGAERCPGSEGQPVEPPSLASWLPLRPGLTPHGLRHGHQTWLDDLGVRYVLQSERMGDEVPGMRGVYSHITPRMRAELRDRLQMRWESSLHDRALLAERSTVALLNEILARCSARLFLALLRCLRQGKYSYSYYSLIDGGHRCRRGARHRSATAIECRLRCCPIVASLVTGACLNVPWIGTLLGFLRIRCSDLSILLSFWP